MDKWHNSVQSGSSLAENAGLVVTKIRAASVSNKRRLLEDVFATVRGV